jgi:hypothetical protein
VIDEVNHQQRARQAEPGDGVLQMVVGQVDAGLAADGIAAGIGGRPGLEEEAGLAWGRSMSLAMAGRSAKKKKSRSGRLSGTSQFCVPEAG